MRVGQLWNDRMAPLISRWRPAPADLQITTLSSFNQFQQHADLLAQRWEEDAKREQTKALPGRPFEVPGYCYPCRGWRLLSVTWDFSSLVDGELQPNWREQL